jgi:hypothetical protein
MKYQHFILLAAVTAGTFASLPLRAQDDSITTIEGTDIPAPQSALEWVFYHYGTSCFGMGWRFLNAVADAESSLDPNETTGSYVGLFQWRKSDCEEPQNIGPFTDFLSCDDLTDPEVNTAVSAQRFHRMFRAERFRDGRLQADATWPTAMLDACPEATVEQLAALAYVGHNNGPGALRSVLRRLEARGRGCDWDEQEAAVRRFYTVDGGAHAATAADVERCNQRSSIVDHPSRAVVLGEGHRNCITANYGEEKWRYGRRRVVPAISAAGIDELYPDGARNPDFCPVYDGQRLYDDPGSIAD